MNLGIGSRVRNEELGVGIVIQSTSAYLVISFVNHGVMEMEKSEVENSLEVLEAVDSPKGLITMEQVEKSIKNILGNSLSELDINEIAEKWDDGKLILQPGDANLKPYEMDIETFLHKIVMVRDRLRVMEQRINSSSLAESEKVNLQQYLTKIYGSLTSFNVLFANREDGFKGSGK